MHDAVAYNSALRRAAVPAFMFLSFILGAGTGLHFGDDSHPDVAVSRRVVDLGTIRQGVSAEHTFTLTNKSRRLLELADVQTSCSCTVAVPSGRSMRPGESIRLRVKLDTMHRIGRAGGACLLGFADRVTKPLKLEVQANIFSPTARFSHDQVCFPEIVHGSAVSRIITFTSENNWRITGLSSSSPLVTAKYQSPSREILCEVSDKAPVGALRERVFIDVESPEGASRITIPVLAEIVESIHPMPKRLFLGRSAPRQLHRCQIVIIGPGKAHIAVPQRTEGVSVCQHPSELSRFDVEITAPTTSGFFTGEIKFPADLDSVPYVTVQYSGIVRP
jgi:hypothetical protein